MKIRKLLAAGLAVCGLFTLTACKSTQAGDDLDKYKEEEQVLESVSVGSGETAGTLTFASIDSDTVEITGYVGPTQPHSVTVPATVRTSTDESVAPKKVTRISALAFYSLSNITEVVLPEGLEEIGEFAFAYCLQLERVTLPTTLKKVETGVFKDCAKLASVGDLAATQLTMISEACYWGCTGLATELTVPANIKTIGEAAFFGCTSLEKIVLAEGVETIESSGFFGATSLTELTLPSTLTNTDPAQDLAFYGAKKLHTVHATGNAQAYADLLPKAENTGA